MYYSLFYAFESKDALLFDKIQQVRRWKQTLHLFLNVWHKTRCLKNGISAYILCFIYVSILECYIEV